VQPSPHDRITAIASKQWLLFLAAQARQAGLTKSALKWESRPGGPYERIQKGIYRLRDHPGPPFQLLGAALLAAGEGAVACRRSAGWVLGLDGVKEGIVEIAVAASRSHERTGIRRLVINPGHVVPLGPFRMTDPLTTLLDLADELDDITWEWSLESALRKELVTIDAINREIAQRSLMRCSGVARARRVLALRPAKARPTGSRLETEFIQLIRPVRQIPEPERQYPVIRHNRLVAKLDVAYPEVWGYTEVHGRQHRESLQHDTTRETTVASTLGWLASEVTSKDVRFLPRPTIRRLIEFIARAANRPPIVGT
jgi:hypothetical protein